MKPVVYFSVYTGYRLYFVVHVKKQATGFPDMLSASPLTNAIFYDKIKIAQAVNVEVASLQDSVKGYSDFDKGAVKKFVIDPHGMIV